VFGTFSGRVKEICSTQLLESYFVSLFIVVHKPSGLIRIAVTVKNAKSWSTSVIYYIVWLLLRSRKLVASNQCMKLWDAYIDTKQVHFRSNSCIDEFFSAKHDCATGSQPA